MYSVWPIGGALQMAPDLMKIWMNGLWDLGSQEGQKGRFPTLPIMGEAGVEHSPFPAA